MRAGLGPQRAVIYVPVMDAITKKTPSGWPVDSLVLLIPGRLTARDAGRARFCTAVLCNTDVSSGYGARQWLPL